MFGNVLSIYFHFGLGDGGLGNEWDWKWSFFYNFVGDNFHCSVQIMSKKWCKKWWEKVFLKKRWENV